MSSVNQVDNQSQNKSDWRQQLYGYFSLARISNSPTVASNALAGAALAGVTVVDWRLAVIALSMVLFYTAGMYLNDILDYEIDVKENRDRPLTTGLISMQAAIIATAALFIVAGGVLLAVGLRPFIGGLLLTGTIVLYDAWHKTNPLSPVVMGANRFLVYVIAFVAFEPILSAEVIIAGGLLWVYIIGLTFVAKSETGDNFTRYWPVLTLIAPALYFGVLLIDTPAWLLLVAASLAWVGYSVSFIYRKEGRSIGGAITRLIAGVSLLDAMVMATGGWTGGVIAALVAFILTLVFQRYIRGT